ncbi:DNA polymerase [Cryobacterium sp. M91]|uniref:DNA polymerase n=1 Tax=Cryobacterium sp. M91 TaxID=2048294 RepID=UPI000CE3232C|nr:DNA polymerase [Cryobacterium sp. M91]
MRTVFFDLETASATELYTHGPSFCRLAGYAVDDGPVVLTTDMAHLCAVLRDADRVVAHNAIMFDLAALERWHGLDVGQLIAEGKVRDTLLLARHNDPPFAGHADDRRYNLDAIGKQLFGLGKDLSVSGESTLDELSNKFGGYDQIPVDEPSYRRYLVRDVELLREVAAYLNCDEYVLREHRVIWRLTHISKRGFRVDVVEARRRLVAQQRRVSLLKQRMAQNYGLPTSGTAPQRTKAGIAALEKAFTDCGVEPPRTPKGALATGKDSLGGLLQDHPDNEALVELVETLRALNGERSVTQTTLDHTGSDGRVHPSVDARQTTGRISVTKPGLTVMGKRDRANVLERALLLPDQGDVLIAFDLSQVDARAIAAHCQDAAYVSAFERGKDYHTEMAVELFGDASRRNDAKPVTHATTYGMGAKGLAASAGIGHSEAQALLNKLDGRFPGLARFKKQVRAEAERKHILWNAFGRPMRVQKGREYTTAAAAMGQGTARDLMMEGILRLPEWLLPCLRAIVHDEIVLSVPTDRAEEAETAVMNALQFSFAVADADTPVLVLADKSERGRDWADCYRTEKKAWPEVARAHREQLTCDDIRCTWHTTDNDIKEGSEA